MNDHEHCSLQSIKNFCMNLIREELPNKYTYIGQGRPYFNIESVLVSALQKTDNVNKDLILKFIEAVANKSAYFLVSTNSPAHNYKPREETKFEGSIIHYDSDDLCFILTGLMKYGLSGMDPYFSYEYEGYSKYLSFPGYKKTIESLDPLCWIPDYNGPAKRQFTVIRKDKVPEIIPDIFDKFGQKFETDQAILFQGSVGHNIDFYLGTVEKIHGSGKIRVNLLLNDGKRYSRIVNDPVKEMLVMNEDFYQNVIIHKLMSA